MRDEPSAAVPTPDSPGPASATRVELTICPYLRAVAPDDSLGEPVRWPHPDNRCVALGDPSPQSSRQQEIACLAGAHVTCQRFTRALVTVDSVPGAGRSRPRVTPAIVGSLLVLAASFALSVGFVVANGGLDLPAAAGGGPTDSPSSGALGTEASPGSVAAASGSPPAPPSPEPSAGAGSSPEPTSGATSVPSTPLAPPPAASAVTPSPAATLPAATPRPSSDRYLLLKPCPDAPDCWIYTVRSGDNLVSIARYFGVPLEDVARLNPWTETTQLVSDQELRLPPPTR